MEPERRKPVMKVKARARLAVARAEHGYSIRELSQVSGVSTATISRAENGQSLSVRSAGKLCRTLDEPFEALFIIKKEDEDNEQRISYQGTKTTL